MDADPIPALDRVLRAGACLALVTTVPLFATGCQGGSGALSRWRIAHDEGLAKPITDEEVGDTRGPLARLFAPEKMPTRLPTADPAVSLASAEKSTADPAIEADFRTAEELMQAGRLNEAEQLLVKLKKRSEQGSLGFFFGGEGKSKDKSADGVLNRRGKKTAWGEKALFLLAETQFQQGKLVAANDSLVTLMTTYPGTRYQEEAVQREYEIGVAWLEAIDPNAPPERREHFGDRFNGRMPPVDIAGHAIQVFEHVRHHDVDGPLADDAVMRIADYHYNAGSFDDASVFYDQLIADHPKSNLLQTAYLRSIDSKLKAYSGPDYDVAGLEKARDQIHQVMTLFPERQASTTDVLSHSLDLIEDQQAEILFRRGEFYRQTGYPGAAELCFGEVKTRWPKSEWAPQAVARLEEIARMPRKVVEPSKIMTLPGSGDPFGGSSSPTAGGPGGGGMGGMGGMGGGGIPTGGNGP